MDEIDNHLRKGKMPFRDHIHAKVAIDNRHAVGNPEGSDLSTLRHHIIEVAKKQSYWGEKRPIKWQLLADKMDKEKETRHQLTLTEVETLGEECGIMNKEEILTFLTFHHNLGDLIYLNERGLRDTVIMSPQWLGNIFRYSIIECFDAARIRSYRHHTVNYTYTYFLVHSCSTGVVFNNGELFNLKVNSLDILWVTQLKQTNKQTRNNVITVTNRKFGRYIVFRP